MQVETEWEMLNSYAAYSATHIDEPELFVEKPIAEYTEIEALGKQAQFYRSINIWLAADTAYSNGMISESTYLIGIADAKSMFNTQKKSGTIIFWQLILAKHRFLADKEIINTIGEELDR